MSYGKNFASMYSGSLFGKPPIIFAVWTYVIANMRPPSRGDGQCYVEVNPLLLAATFATSIEEVDSALLELESPDPASRSKREEGRRLVLIGEDRVAGPRQYWVVNGSTYREIRDDDERREQNREAKRRQRTRSDGQPVSASVIPCHPMSATVSHGQPVSAQAEADEDADAENYSDSRPKVTTWSEESEPLLTARYLFSAIQNNDSKAKEPPWQRWAAEIDRLHRIDGRDFDEIRRVIDWCQRDSFWRANILSATALRKSYGKLVLKMKTDAAGPPVRGSAVSPRRVPIVEEQA